MSADLKPGTYTGLKMEAYLALPAVSASLVKAIVNECPRAAWWDSWLNPARVVSTSDAMDTGTIAHSILLEGSASGVEVIDPEDHPAEKTGAIPTGWTNKSIKLARDAAREAGKIPVLKDDFAAIEAMVASARDFITSCKANEPAVFEAFKPSCGESELTMIWQDGDTLCKMRPDRISKDRKLIIDYKTSARSVEPDSWGRTQMVGMGYYLSAAWYRRGVEALCGVSPAYVFLAQEVEPPYLCSLVGVDPHAFELGAQKIEHGLNAWRACVRTGKWPAYPSRVCYPEIPAWEDSRWEERQAQEFMAQPVKDPARTYGELQI